ncbi:LutC/YkgG family protein [Winogradskyella psychrotolerans]|uniref:LutC/YkgG family protein n=1 Tax=Winogradskyella psychrotolerans TaxID=1344585 RepID=UPI001C07C6A2|nr:LUD domain-containing protein [Winogradskyella psychrotolerans]MBU2929895.1 LUD domain-containing protein [Winogradskyella psychrotolerans]
MSSREHILSKAKENKPEAIALPNIDLEVFKDAKVLSEEFILKVETAGGNVLNATSDKDVIAQINTMFPDTKVNFSTLEGTESFNTVDLNKLEKPHDLENLDVLVLRGDLGVAENGAIWIPDHQIPMRVLPFISKHLVLVIKKETIVPFLHQAYQKLGNTHNDFGVFISGPSKTADIEQSLVIGAHGALSLSVFVQ